jgi:hypothetical protein
MKDQEFLMWIHGRLTEVHGESPTSDFMHKLRAIIKATPKKKVTQNMVAGNCLDDLKRELGS